MVLQLFKSVRTSIAVTAIFFTVTLSIIVMNLAVREHDTLYLQSTTADLAALSTNISHDLLPYFIRGDGEGFDQFGITSVLLRLESYETVMFANVYDQGFQQIYQYLGQVGRLNIESVKSLSDQLVEPPLSEFHKDGYLYSVKRIGDTEFPQGYLVVAIDIDTRLSQSKWQLVTKSLPYLLMTIVLMSLLYYFVLGKQLKPLLALSDFTRRLQFTKDYSERMPVSGRNEVSHLTKSINAMIATIETELNINKEQTSKLIEQQRTMTKLANYDSLTGLPNRQFVMDTLKLELSRAKRAEQDLVLMFFDLDGFKSINDSLGHEIGDKVLIDVAGRVNSMMRDGDLVARLGGDEFLVIPSRETSDSHIKFLAQRLIDAFNEPFFYNGIDLFVGISIGVSKAVDANFDVNELVSNADIAMYRSKSGGKGIYTIFDSSMIEDHRRKLMIANSINTAMSNDEFSVQYQPKVSSTGEIVGFETLLRWVHPTLGMVSPAEFIPIAEQSGKIPAITAWVLERACKDMPTIKQTFSHRFRVSVNLSAFDLRNPGLFDYIHDLFERYNIDPRFFELEVTESAYLESFTASDKFFRRVSNMGCAISLDDFGTGYSSLGYLTQISIDTLKVDRQFVEALETSERSRMVTGTIIDLAKRLNLTICAEGIENAAQIDYLLSQGCDHLQGFYFSKPLPLDELLELSQYFTMPDSSQDEQQLSMPY